MKVKKSLPFGLLILLSNVLYAQNFVDQHVGPEKLQGVSVAIIDNYELKELQYAGVKSKNSMAEVDANTAFSAASISKPVTAIICAILEERGVINLNDPIDNYLERWHLPSQEKLSHTNVTWEHLLSHTSGATQGGFEDFYEGDDLPTIVESLKGQIPGYDQPISFQFIPGTNWQYSGGGYTIIQMGLEDTMDKSLAELAQELLFDPLGMSRTTMYQPNSDKFLDNVALAHNESGEVIRTGIPITPQIAASGMWTTPSDFSKLIIEIQKALEGKPTQVISRKVAERVTDVYTLKGVGGWSLGFERKFGFGNNDWFSHGGANTGTGGYLYATMKGGRGVIAFGNGPNKVRMPIINSLRDEIINQYQWSSKLNIKDMAVPEELASQLEGIYLNEQGIKLFIKDSTQKIWAKPAPQAPWFPFKYMYGQTFYFEMLYPNLVLFEKNQSNWAMTLIRNGVSDSLKNFFVKKQNKKVQVTFQVYVPDKKDKLFITGNQAALGNWKPDVIQLENAGGLKRTITLELTMPAEFKFTKGSWKKEAVVESTSSRQNIKLDLSKSDSVHYTITKWHINP